MLRIALISTFLPTQCGIATYSHDLINSIASTCPSYKFTKIELTTSDNIWDNGNVRVKNDETSQFIRVCEFINSSDVDIVDIQHEFKIFGKPDGENALVIVRLINKPIVSTLHTVFSELNDARESIMYELIKRSDLLYVFSKEAKSHIAGKYRKPRSKIEVIPHGVPPVKFKDIQDQQQGTKSKPILFVSAGHMRNTKGYETAILALHSLKNQLPEFKYLILGANHPQNETAILYREWLIQLIKELNLAEHVTFNSNYLIQTDLIKHIQLADICLLPYTRKDQSSSGILALMVACGRPIVSTPFQFAKSYVGVNSGIISESFEVTAFASAIKALFEKRNLWKKISQNNHHIGEKWDWMIVGERYGSGYSRLMINRR